MQIDFPEHYALKKLSKQEGVDELRKLFPDGKADDLNFCLFSTSGVHGSYATLEDIEAKETNGLTVLVIQPRTVVIYYGQVLVALDDLPFLYKLRHSSRQVLRDIAFHGEQKENRREISLAAAPMTG